MSCPNCTADSFTECRLEPGFGSVSRVLAYVAQHKITQEQCTPGVPALGRLEVQGQPGLQETLSRIPGMTVHAFKPITLETEAVRSLNLGPA